jgi:hypothetical protein
MTGRSTSALPAEMRRPAVHADNLVAVSPFRQAAGAEVRARGRHPRTGI